MILFQPRLHFKGKTCGVNQKFFRLGVGDDIGLLVKETVPLSAAGIKINSLFGEMPAIAVFRAKNVL